MVKVFVVSEYVFSAQNSTGYFWSKIIDKAGASFGSVSVVAPCPVEPGCVKSPVAGVEYLQFYSIPFDKGRFFSRLLGQAWQCIGFMRHVFGKVRRDDVVLSGTNPSLLLLLMPFLKLFKGFRWLLLVHDVYPENLVPAGILKKDSLAYRFLSRVFASVYSRADHIVVIGRDMKDLVGSKTGRVSNITVIPNWVSDKDVVPLNRNDSEIINQLGWQDKIVFQFFGNIGRVQGIDNLLRAIRLVKSTDAAFLFIGEGTAADSVRSFLRNHPERNVAYIGPIPQSEKNKGLAACDVALITLEQGMLGLGVPSKAYFSMAAGRPLLAVMESQAEISRMVRDESIGWSCDPSDPVALAALIDQICQQGVAEIHDRARQGGSRKVLQEKYSEAVALESFVTCIDSVIGRPRQ